MASRCIIRGGRIIDPSSSFDERQDLLIVDGKIAEIGKIDDTRKARILDAEGCLVFPGFVDIHSHLREPGYEAAEDIETGTVAAAAGGFVAVCAMPNTNPPVDTATAVAAIRSEGESRGIVPVFPVGAMTRERAGETVAELWSMAQAGAVAFSDDGSCIQDAAVMRRVMEYVADIGRPLLLHEEDTDLAGEGVAHEGDVALRCGLAGIPETAETVPLLRDLELAALTGCRIHVQHVSTARGVGAIRAARSRGVAVSCEVTPHHLRFTHEAIAGFDTNAKINPPLRTDDDCVGLVEALVDGSIVAVATDHAPHPQEQKEKGFASAPFGTIGLETAVAAVYSLLVATEKITLTRFADIFSTGPRSVLGWGPFKMAIGEVASLTIVDPASSKAVDLDSFYGKSTNSIFLGSELSGWPRHVVSYGSPVLVDGEVQR